MEQQEQKNGKFDYSYSKITDRMLELIESGKLDWRRPCQMAFQQNFATKHVYQGFNQIVTMYAGFSSPFWMTAKQIQERNGSWSGRGTLITFWMTNKYFKTSINEETGEEERKEKRGFYLKISYVWNADQITGIDFSKRETVTVHNPIKEAEAIIENMPNRPTIKEGNEMCYRPTFDMVVMPNKKYFPELNRYYSSMFHELGHSTGHSSRLNREGVAKLSLFGSHTYSFEELVAELTASFLCSTIGIANENSNNESAAYMQGWLKPLQNDKRMFFRAASQAQKATNYILGKLETEKPEEDENGKTEIVTKEQTA